MVQGGESLRWDSLVVEDQACKSDGLSMFQLCISDPAKSSKWGAKGGEETIASSEVSMRIKGAGICHGKPARVDI